MALWLRTAAGPGEGHDSDATPTR